MAPQAKVSLDGQDASVRFGDTLGLVAEGGYVSCSSLCWSINLRFAHQSYEAQQVSAGGKSSPATSDTLNGDQIGVNMFLAL
ncbi:hypothetical protein [Hyalangium minutum]|nr:hypothetical protein [Hyalangium minutum]